MRLHAQSRPATLRYTVRDEDGIALDATTAPTVTIYDDSDTQVQTGTATDVGVGAYTFALSATVRNTLGAYTARWSYAIAGQSYTATTAFEIVSDYLFEIADLRAHDYALEDADRYPSEMIRAARDAAHQRIENAAQVGFVKHVRRVTLSGNDRTNLSLPDTKVSEVEEVWLDGVELDLDDVDILDSGLLVLDTGWPTGNGNIEVRYTHGYESVPDPVRQAAMTLATEYLVTSSLPARATAQSTDLGEFRITVANVDAGRDTGIPEVDAVIARFGARRPTIG